MAGIEEITDSDEDLKNQDESARKEILELVQKCGAGDREALQAFFDRYSEDIYNFPIKVFHLDEDAASDFYLYAFERLKEGGRFKSFQGRSSFRTWFYTVLRNLVIDWMRTIRELNTVPARRVDERGKEFATIENTPDPRLERDLEDTGELEDFFRRLQHLSLELRTVFKLTYIYYLDLSPEEMDYLAGKAGRSLAELTKFMAGLKHELADREIKNIGYEDKITSLYVSILDLKTKKEKILSGLEKPGDLSPEDEFEIEKIDRNIEKKYQQREKLLEKKEKGHFVVRTPYKYITRLMDIPEGSVSVHMMRALEKLRGKK